MKTSEEHPKLALVQHFYYYFFFNIKILDPIQNYPRTTIMELTTTPVCQNSTFKSLSSQNLILLCVKSYGKTGETIFFNVPSGCRVTTIGGSSFPDISHVWNKQHCRASEAAKESPNYCRKDVKSSENGLTLCSTY